MSSVLFSKQSDKGVDAQPTVTESARASRAPETRSPSKAAAPAEGRAHLDRGTKVAGKLWFEGPVWIDGEVDGEIAAKDSVTIGESAVVSAQIRAATVLVAGKVTGNITAAARIELGPSAQVECDLASPVVVIQDGARFDGRCSMGPDDAACSERKLDALPVAERPPNGGAGQKQSGSSTARTTVS